MGNYFARFSRFLSTASYSQKVGLIALFIILAALPLTVIMSQRQQETRQRATGTCVDTADYSAYCAPSTAVACFGGYTKTTGLSCDNGGYCCVKYTSPTPTRPEPTPDTCTYPYYNKTTCENSCNVACSSKLVNGTTRWGCCNDTTQYYYFCDLNTKTCRKSVSGPNKDGCISEGQACGSITPTVPPSTGPCTGTGYNCLSLCPQGTTQVADKTCSTSGQKCCYAPIPPSSCSGISNGLQYECDGAWCNTVQGWQPTYNQNTVCSSRGEVCCSKPATNITPTPTACKEGWESCISDSQCCSGSCVEYLGAKRCTLQSTTVTPKVTPFSCTGIREFLGKDYQLQCGTSATACQTGFTPVPGGLVDQKNTTCTPNVCCYKETTITITPKVTVTPRATITTAPRTTITPTTPPVTGNTYLAFVVGLDGIGATGDQSNPNAPSGNEPKTTTRDFKVEIFDGSQKAAEKSAQITYNQAKKFETRIDVTTEVNSGKIVASKPYIIKVSAPGYLTRTVPPGQILVNKGQVNNLGGSTQQINLITGDMDPDNDLDIMDYNILLSCWTKDATGDCKVADLTDNAGKINQDDYTLFLRELFMQKGN